MDRTIEKLAMHELSICQDLLVEVTRIAESHGASHVDRVIVAVGPLSGVEPPLLERAFSVVKEGTIAKDCVLAIEFGTIRVLCRKCNRKSDVSTNNLTCRFCGDWQVDVEEGEELLLKTVELSGLSIISNEKPSEAKPSQAAEIYEKRIG